DVPDYLCVKYLKGECAKNVALFSVNSTENNSVDLFYRCEDGIHFDFASLDDFERLNKKVVTQIWKSFNQYETLAPLASPIASVSVGQEPVWCDYPSNCWACNVAQGDFASAPQSFVVNTNAQGVVDLAPPTPATNPIAATANATYECVSGCFCSPLVFAENQRVPTALPNPNSTPLEIPFSPIQMNNPQLPIMITNTSNSVNICDSEIPLAIRNSKVDLYLTDCMVNIYNYDSDIQTLPTLD